jgi:hypothetical protein
LQPPLAVAVTQEEGTAPVPAELANLRLDMNVRSSRIQPLYMPVFILEFLRFGANFRVFVCGLTGRVGGESHFSPLKAYVASGAVVTAVLSSLPLNLLCVKLGYSPLRRALIICAGMCSLLQALLELLQRV